ncbi:hypothetical protein Q5P01_022560 [Channa striata]|uniref:Uncharacterized protein n=1 Tax=Channa striata TaxID=64152 RepID=A0AA88LRE1_CHASR|nr:hypothetical protein Q5P01_022560 [Channa striata]
MLPSFGAHERKQVTAPLSPCSLHRTPLHACCHPEGRCITLGRVRNSSPLSRQPPYLLHGTVASCGPCTSPGLHHSRGPHSTHSPSESTAPSHTLTHFLLIQKNK